MWSHPITPPLPELEESDGHACAGEKEPEERGEQVPAGCGEVAHLFYSPALLRRSASATSASRSSFISSSFRTEASNQWPPQVWILLFNMPDPWSSRLSRHPLHT